MKIGCLLSLLTLALTLVSPHAFSNCSESMDVGSMASAHQDSARKNTTSAHDQPNQNNTIIQRPSDNRIHHRFVPATPEIRNSMPDIVVNKARHNELMQNQMQYCCIYVDCKTCDMSVCSAVAMVHSFTLTSEIESVVAIGFVQEFIPTPSPKTLLRPPIIA